MDAENFIFLKKGENLKLKFNSPVYLKIGKLVSQNELELVQPPSLHLVLTVDKHTFPLKSLISYSLPIHLNRRVVEVNEIYKIEHDAEIDIVDNTGKELDYEVIMFYYLSKINFWERDFVVYKNGDEIDKIKCYYNLKIDTNFHAESISKNVFTKIDAKSSEELMYLVEVKLKTLYGEKIIINPFNN